MHSNTRSLTDLEFCILAIGTGFMMDYIKVDILIIYNIIMKFVRSTQVNLIFEITCTCNAVPTCILLIIVIFFYP